MKALRFLRLLDDDSPVLSLTHIAVWVSIGLLLFTAIHNHTLSLPELVPFLAAVAMYDQKRRRQCRAVSETLRAGQAAQDSAKALAVSQGAQGQAQQATDAVKALQDRLNVIDMRTRPMTGTAPRLR